MQDCVERQTCKYVQPFFVGINNKRFKHQSTDGYLPALCEPAYCERYRKEEQPHIIEHIVRTSDMGKAEFDLLQQTALKADYLQKTFIEHIKPKPKAQSKLAYRGIK